MRIPLPELPQFFLHVALEVEGHTEDEPSAELVEVRHLMNTLGASLMATLHDLQAKVTANTSVVNSAVALIQGLKIKLDEAIASGDPAAIQALADALDTSDTALAAAITANTPAAVVAGGTPAGPPAEDPPTTTVTT